MTEPIEIDRRLNPKHASFGFLPGRDSAIADRLGGFLQVVAHGSLHSSEIDDFYGADDADIEYVEVVRTRPGGGSNQRFCFLITPEAAIALGERLAELGREALERQGG